MSCKRIVLHIGMDKTGSSSIRTSLARRLKDPAVHYVQPGGNLNASKALAEAFMEDPTQYITHRLSGLTSDQVPALRTLAFEALDAEFAKAQGRMAVLSAEAVSRFGRADCERIAEYLLARTGDLRVVAYIRRPKGYMESNFQQAVKSGAARALVPQQLLSDYQARFEPIEQAFGRDRVSYYLFDPPSFPDSDVVMHFCRTFGIAFAANQSVRINEGLSRNALALLFAYRKHGRRLPSSPTFTKANQLLFDQVSKLRGPKFRLHSDVVAPVVEARRAAIAWIADRMGASMDEDIRGNDADAVRSEADLLAVPDEASRWLAEKLGPAHVSAWKPGMGAPEVAQWMNELVDRLLDAVAGSTASK